MVQTSLRTKLGRPRSPETQMVVVNSVLELVGDGATLTSLSFVSIAEHAGISRNSLYRRWRTKERLLMDVVSASVGEVPDVEHHSAREDLVALLEYCFGAKADPRTLRMERAVNAESQNFANLFEFYNENVVAPRSSSMKRVIRRGKESREIRVDVDENVLADLLMRACHPNCDVVADFGSIVDLVFDGVTTI